MIYIIIGLLFVILFELILSNIETREIRKQFDGFDDVLKILDSIDSKIDTKHDVYSIDDIVNKLDEINDDIVNKLDEIKLELESKNS